MLFCETKMAKREWVISEITIVLIALTELCIASHATKIVAAIDLGTTYSAFAFAWKTNLDEVSINIELNKAWKTDFGSGMQLMKTPTTILFDKERMFHSFGYQAEKYFTELSLRNEHKEWYYFRRFKTLLYPKKREKNLNLDTLLRTENFWLDDEHDKKMLAIDVFSQSIKYLQNAAFRQINERGDLVKPEDVKWVLTVPAIWDEAAKQFIHKAAIKAGIPDGNLVLALEPEAASLYYIYSEYGMSGMQTSGLNVNSSYIVLDAGGGIADIVSHEMTEDRSLIELYEPIGGDWGGVQVDLAYHQLLISLFGEPVLRNLKKNYFHALIYLMEKFEVAKYSVTGDSEDKFLIQIPSTLETIFEQMYNETLGIAIKRTSYRDHIEWIRGGLIFQGSFLRSLFSDCFVTIKNAMRKLLKERAVSGTDTIVLTGDFAESKFLQNFIKTEFKDRKVLIPLDPSLTIVKGAVLFGHMPNSIQSRKCKTTYGISAVRQYIPGDIQLPNTNMADGIFDKLVEKGESLRVGTLRNRTYSMVNQSESTLHLKMYTSTTRNPKYVSDRECSFLGDLIIDGLSSDLTGVFVETKFGDVELAVHASEQYTNNSINAIFNFLQ